MTILDSALKDAQKDSSAHQKFYSIFKNAMLYVPITSEKNPVIIRKGEESFMPVFDTEEKLLTWAEKQVKYERYLGSNILKDTERDLTIVLNPGTAHAKKFYAEEIELLLTANIEEMNDSKSASQNSIVNSIYTTPKVKSEIENYLEDFPEVKAAYLADVTSERGVTTYIAMEIEDGNDDTLAILEQNLALQLQRYFEEVSLKIISTGNPTGRKIKETIPPLYNFS